MTDPGTQIASLELEAATAAAVSVAGVDVGRIDQSLADARAGATRRNYDREWRRFTDYCQTRNLLALPAPADVVCDYLLSMENTLTDHPTKQGSGHAYSVSAISLALAAIKFVHRTHAGTAITPEAKAVGGGELPLWAHPRVSDTMTAIRNRYAAERRRPTAPRAPLSLADLTLMVETARTGAFSWRRRLHERRDTAVLLIGWSGAARRSEVMALQVGDIRYTPDRHAQARWVVDVATSKTDQAGDGQLKALPTGQHLVTCGPCAYVRWVACLEAFERDGRAGLIRLLAAPDRHTRHACTNTAASELDSTMPLFRGITRSAHLSTKAPGGQLVHQIVRRRLAAARPDLDITAYGAHSLRAGFVTEAFEQGHTPRDVMRQTGHKQMDSVLRYGREKDIWTNNAATKIGM